MADSKMSYKLIQRWKRLQHSLISAFINSDLVQSKISLPWEIKRQIVVKAEGGDLILLAK